MRAVPPAPPVIGAIVEYPDDVYDYGVDVTLPADADLHVDAAQQCTTSYDQSRWSIADPLQDGRWGLYDVPTGPVCLSFYAVDWDGSGQHRGDPPSRALATTVGCPKGPCCLARVGVCEYNQ